VISDGLEKNSAVKEKEVIRAIKENDVQLYLIGFLDEDKSKSFFGTSQSKKAQQLLSRLADDSGGRAFFPNSLYEIPGIAAQIAKDLRTQYIISYYPNNEKRDGTYRTVQVDVKSKRKIDRTYTTGILRTWRNGNAGTKSGKSIISTRYP
jgi:Ca-activated chloride channel homolog